MMLSRTEFMNFNVFQKSVSFFMLFFLVRFVRNGIYVAHLSECVGGS